MARPIKKQNLERILHHPSLLKGIVIMAIPVFLNNFLKSLHDMVDAIFVARMDVGSQATLDAALAALNIHWPVFNFFMALAAGLGIATVAMVSQYVGAGRKDLASSYASKLITLAMIFAILVMAIFYFTSDVFLGYNLFAYLMGARGEALGFAGEYFRIRSYEFILVFIFIVYQSIRQATGETLYPVLLNIGGIFVNIMLTWLFVSRFQMGIAGAAYATLIAHAAPMPFIIYDLFKSKHHIRISLKEMMIDKLTLSEMGRFAIPASVGQAMSALGFVIIQSIILRYGDMVSAGFSVGNRISSLLLNPVVAISTISAAFVGLNIGHAQPERAKKAYEVSRNLSFGLMVLGIALIIPFRFPIIELILGTNSSDSYRIAGEYTLWLLLTQPFMGLFQSYIGLFNGSGHSNYTLKISMVRLWGMRIPMIFLSLWLLPPDDYRGIFWAMMISNAVILFYGHYLKKGIKYELQVRL
ncbi:MAG TPA: MATE family efflux transporter [Acholeplasmataceae bacterium]|nr:MATE family efflux transporter [Acholeplasmataceae bacterium]